ncbi:NAD(P)-dependent oxidoreductase [Deinococcus roseus]|uniref:3-hydroxyisobutyrate dehydrogenase n=1 Tax=Deinococcus roseus TaxID=392414 RepID=A0ABQ2DJ97_9DEIO|nr:NAD(P)-dependent oxidoreductase [Deinococcus roseus]GGJ55546.1 3-hydroxyisobutyrate dehydrogenase [Deinococcus roseus]
MIRRVAVLGLGQMGQRMALNLLRSGFDLTVYNRTPESAQTLVQAGAKFAATPAEAVQNAEVVISMVRDDVASRFLWLDPDQGALSNLPEGAVAVECSTLTPAWTRELAGHFQTRQSHFLDAPVVGSTPQAASGQLVFLVGGAATDLERVQEVLQAMGSTLHHVGEIGQGMHMKLAVNAFFAGQVALLAELLMFLQPHIPPQQALEVLGNLPVISPALKVNGQLMLERKFAPMFPVQLVVKDLQCLLDTAQAGEVQVPTSSKVLEVFSAAQNQGWGEEHLAAVVKLFESHLSS